MDRALRTVETMPDDGSSEKLLGLEERSSGSPSEMDELAGDFVPDVGTPILVDPVLDDEASLPD
jgi:hypothetical protein